jgi:hypothetical protein
MKKYRILFVLLCIFIPFTIFNISFASAQGDSAWLPQQQIPGYDSNTWPPILVADGYGTVHAFSSQWLNGDVVRVIMYNKWTHEQGWTAPIDVLMSPYTNDTRLLDAFIDPTNRVHVIFWGGNNIDAKIYYSSAPIVDAGNAKAWSAPILVAENAGDPEAGNFAADEHGRIYLLYSGRYGNGVYSTTSDDNGATWAKPTPIYLTNDQDKMPQALHMYKSQSGWLHAIWNVITSGGEGRGIYYSRKKVDDIKWSDPVRLAEAESGYGTNTPAIIEYHGAVLAFYNLGGIIWQRSYDGEKDWTPPVQLFTRHVGVNGSPSLVVDGNDELHIFFGQRITGSPDIHGMWHSIFSGTGWSEPEAVVSGLSVSDVTGDKAFDPFEARAVVSQGNVLMVTWRSDPGLMGNGVWYSEKVIYAPETPLTPLSTIASTTLTVSKPFTNPQSTSNLANRENTANQIVVTPMIPFSDVKPNSYNPSMPLIVSLAPAVLIISIVIMIFYARKKKSMHSMSK